MGLSGPLSKCDPDLVLQDHFGSKQSKYAIVVWIAYAVPARQNNVNQRQKSPSTTNHYTYDSPYQMAFGLGPSKYLGIGNTNKAGVGNERRGRR